MARSKSRKAAPRRASRPARSPPRRAAPKSRKGGFVGRDPSPVLDRYPPRADAPPAPPPVTVANSTGAPRAESPPAPGTPLITLDRGFDVDEFSQMLGESSIRVTVPRDDLVEVLRRVLDFSGFGVYVYSFSVRPAATDLLKEYVVELRRVDFSREKGDWQPFETKESAPP